MKISKTQLVQIIKEEAEKVKKEFILRKELKAIDDELQSLNEMVRPGGEMDPGTGGVHAGQKTPQYDGKPGFPNLKMEKEEGDEAGDTVVVASDADGGMAPVGGSDMGGDEIGDGMGDEIGDDMGGDEMGGGEMIDKTQLLDAIKDLGMKLNLTGVVDFDAAPEGEMGAGLDVDVETGADDAVGAGPDMEAGTEDLDASAEDDSTDTESDGDSENVDETQQQAPTQQTQAPVTAECDNMEEKRMKEEQSQKLNEEKKRWAVLSGIIKS